MELGAASARESQVSPLKASSVPVSPHRWRNGSLSSASPNPVTKKGALSQSLPSSPLFAAFRGRLRKCSGECLIAAADEEAVLLVPDEVHVTLPGAEPGILASTVESRASVLEAAAPLPGWLRRLFWAAGWRPGYRCWGLEPLDLKLPWVRDVEWYANPTGASGDHDDGPETWWDMPRYRTPRVRTLWGCTQNEVHAGAQELFLDLIFVGIAFRVGTVLKDAFYSCDPGDAAGSFSGSASSGDRRPPRCIGLGLGLLHALAPFMAMYLLWRIETSHRSRFAATSKAHKVLDLLGNLLLTLGASCMEFVQDYREDPGVPGLSRVLVPVLVGLVIWIGRTAELALLSEREAARRASSTELIAMAQVLLMWGAALACSMADTPGDADLHAQLCDLSAALMWAGNLWWTWKQAHPAMCQLLMVRGDGVPRLPIERTVVPSNSGFQLSRDNEFMFLMLGETTLQIVIATADTHIEPNGNDLWASLLTGVTLTAVVGFLLAVAMMFSFRQMVAGQLSAYRRTNELAKEQELDEEALVAELSEQSGRASCRESLTRGISCASTAETVVDCLAEKAMSMYDAQRVLLRCRLFNVLGSLLWQTKAMCVMLVGVAVKIAMYAPMAPADAFFASEQRLELALPVALTFFTQFFHAVYIRNRHAYSSLANLAAQPMHVGVVALRLLTFGVGVRSRLHGSALGWSLCGTGGMDGGLRGGGKWMRESGKEASARG